jgi:CheY-like chemotaxis protein
VTALPKGLEPVFADRGQLEQVLLNLVVNARDAMPNGGKLTIETANAYLDDDYCAVNPEVKPGQYVLISVTDSGAGMRKEVIERAFEPFFSTKAVGEGTGLGLSQVYGFVRQSGGHIKIYSEVGQGTTIKLYFPRLLGDASADEHPALITEIPVDRGETLVLVEDEDLVRMYLLEVLTDLNYHVLEAPNAEVGLRYVEQKDQRIDLILTDVVLPGINGRELAKRARALRPNVKILFMTGYSRNAIVHQGRLDPGVDMVQKPVTQADLAAKIRAMLDEKVD